MTRQLSHIARRSPFLKSATKAFPFLRSMTWNKKRAPTVDEITTIIAAYNEHALKDYCAKTYGEVDRKQLKEVMSSNKEEAIRELEVAQFRRIELERLLEEERRKVSQMPDESEYVEATRSETTLSGIQSIINKYTLEQRTARAIMHQVTLLESRLEGYIRDENEWKEAVFGSSRNKLSRGVIIKPSDLPPEMALCEVDERYITIAIKPRVIIYRQFGNSNQQLDLGYMYFTVDREDKENPGIYFKIAGFNYLRGTMHPHTPSNVCWGSAKHDVYEWWKRGEYRKVFDTLVEIVFNWGGRPYISFSSLRNGVFSGDGYPLGVPDSVFRAQGRAKVGKKDRPYRDPRKGGEDKDEASRRRHIINEALRSI